MLYKMSDSDCFSNFIKKNRSFMPKNQEEKINIHTMTPPMLYPLPKVYIYIIWCKTKFQTKGFLSFHLPTDSHSRRHLLKESWS